MTSIEALKRSNKKCGKDEVFQQANNSTELTVATGSKEDKEYHHDIHA